MLRLEATHWEISMTTMLTDEIRGFMGVMSETVLACDAVEAGAVRRYAQAIMDDDPDYAPGAAPVRFGGPIAPPLYPSFMFRRPLNTSDVLTERAGDPDFDGLVPAAMAFPNCLCPAVRCSMEDRKSNSSVMRATARA
jgi:hypothetical protein